MTPTLRIHSTAAENPFRDLIVNFLAREFPANLGDKDTLLESLTAALLATSRTRFGPVPSPESLVLIRAVIRNAIEADRPIPLLMPWGTKKPDNGTVDIAELGGLKTLAALQKRVQQYYAPGLDLVMRIEDTSGNYLFKEEGAAAIAASREYVQSFMSLVRVLGLDFVHMRQESFLMDTEEFWKLSDAYKPFFVRYFTDTMAYGDGEWTKSLEDLENMGWKGGVGKEQREFYLSRYRRSFPDLAEPQHVEKLAGFFATVMARKRLGGYGSEDWGNDFINLSFAPPVPGTPKGLTERRIYYRTLPETMARTHIPPWRARGYLRIEGGEVAMKLITHDTPLELTPCSVVLSGNGEEVEVRADHHVE